jgi:hypothetical protein
MVGAVIAVALAEAGFSFLRGRELITACGRICVHRKLLNISTPLAGRTLD